MMSCSLCLSVVLLRLAFSQTLLQTKSSVHHRIEDLLTITKEHSNKLKDITEIQEQNIDGNMEIKRLLNDQSSMIRALSRELQPINTTFNETEHFWLNDDDVVLSRSSDSDGPNCSIDIVFMIESSTLTCPTLQYKKRLKFCNTFLREAEIDSGHVRVALVTYSTETNIEFRLNTYSKKKDVFDAIDRVTCKGGEIYTADALSNVRNIMFRSENGDRPTARNIVILLTTGMSNINRSLTIPEAEKLKQDNVRIYTVSMHEKYFAAEILSMASKPTHQFVYHLSGIDDLQETGENIFNAICKEVKVKDNDRN